MRTIIRRGAWAVLALCCLCPPLRAEPLPHIGMRGSLTIPFSRKGFSPDTLEGLRVSVSSAPAWFQVLPLSELGPVDLRPRQEHTFRLEFSIGPGFSTATVRLELDYVLSDATSAAKHQWGLPNRCHISSPDVLQTAWWRCFYADGSLIFEQLFPDRTPPVTRIASAAGLHTDKRGVTFAPRSAEFRFEARDPAPPHAEVSGTAFTGFSVDAEKAEFAALKPFREPLRLEEGRHTVCYGSRDAAGNEEAVQCAVVVIGASGRP